MVKSSVQLPCGVVVNNDKICPICMEEFSEKTKVFLQCGHSFHKDCIDTWITSNANCPVCRAPTNKLLLLHKPDLTVDCVKLLLDYGADPNIAMTDDRTTLIHVASQEGHLEVVKALLKKGADSNAAKTDGTTPLMLASIHGHPEVVRELLGGVETNWGADPNMVNRGGYTALMFASLRGHLEVVRELCGADQNAATNNGYTALMMASENGHMYVVAALLGAGADLNATAGGAPGGRSWGGSDDITALKLADKNGHQTIIKLLTERRGLAAAWGCAPLGGYRKTRRKRKSKKNKKRKNTRRKGKSKRGRTRKRRR
jgi:hypothetical protein